MSDVRGGFRVPYNDAIERVMCETQAALDAANVQRDLAAQLGDDALAQRKVRASALMERLHRFHATRRDGDVA